MAGLKTGVENGMFWPEIGSGFGEPGMPTMNSDEYPHLHPSRKSIRLKFLYNHNIKKKIL